MSFRCLLDWAAQYPDLPDPRGQRVLGEDDEPIGRVESLWVDAGSQGKLRFVGVGVHLVPVDAIVQVDEAGLHLEWSRERVLASPSFEGTEELPRSWPRRSTPTTATRPTGRRKTPFPATPRTEAKRY